MLNHQAAGGRDEEEVGGFTVEAGFDERAGVDGIICCEIRQGKSFESPQGRGQFIHLSGLAGGEIGGFETAGVVFSLRLTARIGGGGVGLDGRFRKAFEPGAEFRADLGEQFGFHRRQARLARRRAGSKIRRVIQFYGYEKCSTSRDARKWLDARGIPYQPKAIRETPPTANELKTALDALGGDLKKLLNTSGMDYRALGMKDKLPTMSEAEVIKLLESHGNLVKRPFVIGDGVVLVGFKQDVWERKLG